MGRNPVKPVASSSFAFLFPRFSSAPSLSFYASLSPLFPLCPLFFMLLPHYFPETYSQKGLNVENTVRLASGFVQRSDREVDSTIWGFAPAGLPVVLAGRRARVVETRRFGAIEGQMTRREGILKGAPLSRFLFPVSLAAQRNRARAWGTLPHPGETLPHPGELLP